jgi:hypothetical protein
MDYREYLEFLHESISGLPGIHQKALFNEIRKKDKWIQLAGEVKGWAINLNDGVVLMVFEPDGEHRIYFCWDYFINGLSQVPVDYAESFEHCGYFDLPPNFYIKKA